LEVPLVHQQVFFPIFKGGTGLVFVKVIALVAYLMNWGLVVPIITLKFLQDNHPFLSGVIKANNLGPFSFQVHFRWACDLLSLVAQTSILPFE
jgi:hypothetical protein